jgi:nucleotide-binding universal stress UspA family protein
MTEPAKVVRRRILVALDATGNSLAALDAAAQLATLLDAELSGIFVEDADLLRLAGLPFARESGPGLPSRRVPDIASMERTLRRLADQARAAAEEVLVRHQVACSFTAARGRVLTEVLAAATGADIVAIGVGAPAGAGRWRLGSTARGVLAQASCSILMLREGESLAGPVIALFEDTPGAERVLGTAADLARQGDGRMLILVSGSRDSLAALRARADAFPTAGLNVELHVIDRALEDSLPPLLSRVRCGVLVLSRESSLLGDDYHRAVLDRVHCPVFAVK